MLHDRSGSVKENGASQRLRAQRENLRRLTSHASTFSRAAGSGRRQQPIRNRSAAAAPLPGVAVRERGSATTPLCRNHRP